MLVNICAYFYKKKILFYTLYILIYVYMYMKPSMYTYKHLKAAGGRKQLDNGMVN